MLSAISTTASEAFGNDPLGFLVTVGLSALGLLGVFFVIGVIVILLVKHFKK